MTTTLTISRTGGATLARHTLNNHDTLRIAAQDNVYYQLTDGEGMAVQGVQASRAGQDLIVHMADGQTLIIENYFLFEDGSLKNPL